MTIIENDITQKAAEWLVSGRLPNERAIQLWLAMLLASLDYEVELEYKVASGFMDIYLPERRVVIETKQKADPSARRAADPDDDRDPDSDPSETQFQQCERYVRDEWERQRRMLFDLDAPKNLPYKAILTDGRRWWMWQWEFLANRELGEARRVAKQEFSSGEELEADVQSLIETPRQPGLVL